MNKHMRISVLTNTLVMLLQKPKREQKLIYKPSHIIYEKLGQTRREVDRTKYYLLLLSAKPMNILNKIQDFIQEEVI